MVLLLGHSEDGRGQWEREGSRRKGNFLVYDPTFYHLCFSESWIRMFFSGLRHFFRNRVDKFAGLRSGTFFRPKEDPGFVSLSLSLNDAEGSRINGASQTDVSSAQAFWVSQAIPRRAETARRGLGR